LERRFKPLRELLREVSRNASKREQILRLNLKQIRVKSS
jgi:hypothetical protein